MISVGAEKKPQTGSGRVSILVFSKHLRLLKENKIQKISISPQNGGEIQNGSRRTFCRYISILFADNSFIIKRDDSEKITGDFILYPKKRGDTFLFEINSEKRHYPLPLYVKNSGSEIEFSVEESVNQYSIDSAWGELGDTTAEQSEALYALAHLIKARCGLPYLTNKHKGYDFCDLTCCQTYRGRSGRIFDDPVSINTTGIKTGLFFHTSGGGALFTEAVFNNRGSSSTPPRDIIYHENFVLSRNINRNWEAIIDEHELAAILYPGVNVSLKNITFIKSKEIVIVETGNGKENLSPESFRLKINRVRGWAFIKSNNYTLTKNSGAYKFTGSGLGHGAGMSFDGALQLAEKGYSRYEILEHYYPGLKYNTHLSAVNHQLQYIIFNQESGEIIKLNGSPSFRYRTIPCGSVFKLFIALYLSEKRTDLFYNYIYTCTDKEKDSMMPDSCWKKSGHGRVDITSALSHSCNKYFASLYSRIDTSDFLKWISNFSVKNGIELTIPHVKNKGEFSNLLAGLNFNVTITIDGLMKLNRYIYLESKEHKSEASEIIINALYKTFTEGTAKESEVNNQKLSLAPSYNTGNRPPWGKTGTVIAGTNSHHGYGIFTGGISSTGIVSILRKGTGAMAAEESEKILLNLN